MTLDWWRYPMAEEMNVKSLLRKALPRVLKATFWGFLMGGEALLLYRMLEFGGQFASFFPSGEPSFLTFMVIFVSFEVAIQLLSGTIFPYVLGVARALISMVLLVYVTNGGIITITAPPDMGVMIRFVIDFRTILAVFLLFSLATIVKNVLQAVEFLSERAEQPMIPAEIP